jgi:hypothetical protein
MSRLRFYLIFLSLLVGAVAATTAHAQPPNASTNDANGTRPLPPIPGEVQDLPDKYKNDSSVGIALREQERLNSRLRQKQLNEATDLLLKVARDLRAEMAASPNAARTQIETERLRLIEKLAHLIQEREKAEDQVTAALATTGRAP